MRDLDLLKHPDGSKKHPASTCKDLHMSHPKLESGKNLLGCLAGSRILPV
jgi:hypothetical protein